MCLLIWFRQEQAFDYITLLTILQCPGGDKAVTVSKAEKAAIALCAAFVLFFAGWCARGVQRGGYYEVTSDALLPRQAASPTVQPSFVPEVLVDLNTATLADLTGLPGVGETRAQAILDYRAEHGPFEHIEDVMRVKGVGEGIFQQMEAYVTVTVPEGGQTP